jgi:hypothetical protein
MRYIAVATEDELSEQVGVRLVSDAGLSVSMKLRKSGNGYLRSSLDKFSAMAQRDPVLLITDLDTMQSPQHLTAAWFNHRLPPQGLLFHIAVREVEAWLISDHAGMKKLLGTKVGKIPPSPEDLANPKATLLGLAAKANREVREDLIVERNAMASQGLGYNARLCDFVRNTWQPNAAAERAPSLAALMADLNNLR